MPDKTDKPLYNTYMSEIVNKAVELYVECFESKRKEYCTELSKLLEEEGEILSPDMFLEAIESTIKLLGIKNAEELNNDFGNAFVETQLDTIAEEYGFEEPEPIKIKTL